MHNPDFKPIEFDRFKKEAGYNAFSLSPQKWIENTNAIGIVSKPGRYGGTFAHSDIAFEFASWISAEFKLYIIKDYKRLKSDESSRISLEWNLIPPELTPRQISITYASEADVLNVALFGITAKQWRENNSGKKGNIRDYATLNQLLVLANLESYNAILIEQGKIQADRLQLLNKLAIRQLNAIREINIDTIKKLENK